MTFLSWESSSQPVVVVVVGDVWQATGDALADLEALKAAGADLLANAAWSNLIDMVTVLIFYICSVYVLYTIY